MADRAAQSAAPELRGTREETVSADSIRMKVCILSALAVVALIGFSGCATGASVSTADHTVSTSTGIY
jgi:hypothetical protein